MAWDDFVGERFNPTQSLVILSDDHGYQDLDFKEGRRYQHRTWIDWPRQAFDSPKDTHPILLFSDTGRLADRALPSTKLVSDTNTIRYMIRWTQRRFTAVRETPSAVSEGSGYATSWVGKWHLGASPDHVPWKRGFEKTFGFIGGGHQFLGWKPNQRQYTLPLTEQGMPLDQVPEHLTIELCRRAAAFIKNPKASPGFNMGLQCSPYASSTYAGTRSEVLTHRKSATSQILSASQSARRSIGKSLQPSKPVGRAIEPW